MLPRLVSRLFSLVAAGSILSLAAWTPAHSQEQPSESATDLEVDVFDEIIVQGEPTLRLLREEVYEAEENFYDMFNALNEGKQYDIHCFYRTRVGSQIRRRFCEANFVKSEYMPETVVGSTTFRAFVRHKTLKMYEMMVELMEQHPGLHAALMEFGDAKQTYAAAIRDRCANSPMTCRK